MESNLIYTPEELQQADVQGQLEASQVEMPPEEYASLSSNLAKKSIGIFKDMFKRTEEEVLPPKKYTTTKIQEASDAIEPVPSPETLVSRSTSEFDATETYQMNFDTLENADDVNGMIAEVSERIKGEITEARGGIRRDTEIQGLADDLGTSAEFVSEFVNTPDSQFVSPEKILAARKVLNQSAIKLKTLADKVTGNEASDIEKLQFKKQYSFHQQFMMQFMAKRANVGRSLRAYGMPTGSSDENSDAIQAMLMNIHSGLDYNTAAKQISAAPGVKGLHQMVQAQDSLMSKAGNVFMEVFINSILSGIKTHIINTTGSAIMLTTRTMDTFIAARLGTPIETPAEKMVSDEWKAGLFGLVNGMKDGWGTLIQVVKTAEPYGGVSKLETNGRQYISAEYLGIKGASGTAVDYLGNFIRVPTERLMGGIDGFMKTIAERQVLAQVAYRKATNEANSMGLNKDEALQLLQHYMNSPTDAMKQEASETGLHVTFQSPLGKGGQQIQTALGLPGIRYFAPFVKTPINLLKQGFLERTPLAMITKEYQADMAAGGARAQMAKARMYVGSTIGLMGATAAMNGTVTGAGPDDYKQKQALMESGWRPYSIKVENDDGTFTYISYQRTEPLSYVLSTLADLKEVVEIRAKMQLGETEEKFAENITGGLITALSHATLDRSFMTGIQNLMDVLDAPSGNKVNRLIQNFAVSAVPYSGLLRDTTKLFDDTKRTTDDWMSALKRNTPYFNKSLPAALDSYGKELKYDTILSPFPVVTHKETKIEKEIRRLVESVQKSPISKPARTYNGIELSQADYHDWVLLSRKKILINDMTFSQTITQVMNSEIYQQSIDEMKVTMIQGIKRAFDTTANRALMQHSPSYRDKWIMRKTAVGAAQLQAMGEDSTEVVPDFLESLADIEFEIINPESTDLFYNKRR